MHKMNNFPPTATLPSKDPFLRNPQGWKFFLEAEKAEPSGWRGAVLVDTGVALMSVRLRCENSCATEGAALEDAKALAEIAFIKIALRFKCIDESKRKTVGLEQMQKLALPSGCVGEQNHSFRVQKK
jgi:hypothetical protein